MWQLHITRHPTAIWWSHHQKSVWRIPSSQYIPNMPKSITSQTIPNYPKLNCFSLGSIQEKAPFRVHFTDMDHLGWLGWMGKKQASLGLLWMGVMIYGSPLVSSNSQAHEPASLHRHGASWNKLLVMLPLCSNVINLLVLSPQGIFGNDPFH